MQTPRFFVSILPSDHAFFELLRFIDAFEDGSVGIDLAVTGRREDGTQFNVSFGDRWIGAERPGEEFFDSASAGAIGVGLMLSWLVDNPFEKVTLDDVHMDLDVGNANRWVITDVAVGRNGATPEPGSPVCVQARRRPDGAMSRSSPSPGPASHHETFEIRVPQRFGALNVRGGRGLDPFIDPGAFDGFDGLLSFLRGVSSSDTAIVRIVKNGATVRSRREVLNRVVVGQASVALRPLNSPECS